MSDNVMNLFPTQLNLICIYTWSESKNTANFAVNQTSEMVGSGHFEQNKNKNRLSTDMIKSID